MALGAIRVPLKLGTTSLCSLVIGSNRGLSVMDDQQQLGRMEQKLCNVHHDDIKELKEIFKEHAKQDDKNFRELFTFNTRVKQTGSVLVVLLVGLWAVVKFVVPLVADKI
jgi:hypothetical protein